MMRKQFGTHFPELLFLLCTKSRAARHISAPCSKSRDLSCPPRTSNADSKRLMNDSEFGLTASIWTKDTAKGEDLAEHVEAGTVFVNRCDFPSPVSRFSI